MIKPKPCRGINKARNFEGCGQESLNRKYGLCPACLRLWSKTTDEGWAWVQSQVIPKAKKDVKKKEKARKDKLRRELETKSDLEKKLQKEINEIVRILDREHPCISSGRPLGSNYDAGHLFSVGSNPQIRFHLFNIWAQSVQQNQYNGGNPLGYIEGLKKTFGDDLRDYCLSLKGLPQLKLEKHELRQKIDVARRIVKHLKLEDKIYSTEERVQLRKTYNKVLDIY